MKYLILATLCLYGVCTVAGHPTTPIKDLVDRLRSTNGSLELQSKPDLSSGRVVGGKPCESPVPFAVSLQYGLFCPGQPEEWNHFCSGTLISCSQVLTAGHCSYAVYELFELSQNETFPCDIKFRAVYNSAKLEEGAIIVSKNVEVREVTTEMICFPPGFSNYFLSRDISIIHLEEPFTKCDPTALPCLPDCSRSECCPGTIATAYGWGVTSTNGERPSNQLKCVNETIICLSECQEIYAGGTIFGPWITCGRGDKGGICFGDSGGGMVVKYPGDPKCSTVIVGVNSFVSSAGCNEGVPDGFARLCEYGLNAWIRCNLENDREDIPNYPARMGNGRTNVSREVVPKKQWTRGGSGSFGPCGSGDCPECEFECRCQDFESSF